MPRAYSNKYAVWTGFLVLPYACAAALHPILDHGGAVAVTFGPALRFFESGAYAN